MATTSTTSKYRKGQAVAGLQRHGRKWNDRPMGVVTKVHGGWVRVQWAGCAVEDDMRPEWLEPVAPGTNARTKHDRDCPIDPGDEQSAVLRDALAGYGVDAPADACWCHLMDLVADTTAALDAGVEQ